MSMGEAAAGVAPDGGWAPVRLASCRPPVLGAAVASRPRLVDRLVAATAGEVVVVTAGAGYGKTITAGLWERADPRPFAWVALDPLDDDPAHLVAHVAAALAEPGLVDREDVQFLSSPGRSPGLELIPVLGEILLAAPAFVLVVDDVHLVREPTAVDALVALVDAMPPSAVVALLSRTPPLRGTARRRLADQVTELRQPDLALRPDEARTVFAGLGIHVDDATLETLLERCEGWPGGVHLAALALRDRPADAVASFSGRNRLVADYLVEEVLGGLDPTLVDFLEEASVLASFTAAQLDAVVGRSDSGRRLDELETGGCLFLVALDDDAERYRFHHLFRELLEARLRRRDPQRWRALHRTAADVLLAGGDLDGAIHHAVAGDDGARAAALVQHDAVPLALSGRGNVLARRIAMLDDATRRDDVNAATARGWAAVAEGDPLAVRGAISDAKAAVTHGPLADGSASVASAVALMTAFLGDGGLDGVRRNASAAVDRGDRWAPLARAVRATALVQTGAHAEARADLLVAIEGLHPVAGIEAAALELLAWLHGRDGELASAIAYADGGHRILLRHQLQGVVAVVVAWSLDAVTAARVGQRERALEDAAVAEEALDRLGHEVPRTLVFNHQLLAEAHHLLGDGAEARRHLQEAVRVHRTHPLSPWFDLENARLADLLGRGPSGTSLAVTPLTGAERRLLPHLATHLSLPQIAAELHVSRNTVKTHCVSVYRKLGVSSRAEAVAEARRLGLIAA